MTSHQRSEVHLKNRRKFGVLIIVLEITVLFVYGFYFRPLPHSDSNINENYYFMDQDINVMMLIGIGFLLAFIRNHTLSALSYTFFINAVVIQIHGIFANLWSKIFYGGWQTLVFLQQKTLMAAFYCVTAQLIAFGALLGKVGPFQLLVMTIIGTFGYTLNTTIVYQILNTFDAGGSITVHTFGGYLGVGVSRILSCKARPTMVLPKCKITSTMAFIGVFFLWMYWPSINAGYYSSTPFERSLIILNTILTLTGSCVGAFATSALFRHKFTLTDIFNASLGGGVVIGAASGLVTNPGASLAIGFFSGIIETFCFMKLNHYLEEKIGLYDTCGVHTSHGITGILGGIVSAIVLASYQVSPLAEEYVPLVPFHPNPIPERDYADQAGIQIASTFISVGMGLITGIIAGLVLYRSYDFQENQFFEDNHYFNITENPDRSDNQSFVSINPQKMAYLERPQGKEIIVQ